MAKQRKSTKVEKEIVEEKKTEEVVEKKSKGKGKVKKEEVKKEEAEVKKEEKEILQEDPPANACDALLAAWGAGGRGLYDENSEFCGACMEDFKECAEMCKAGTLTKAEKTKVKKEKKERKSNSTKVYNKYHHGVGTQADVIDMALERGAALAEILEEVMALSSKDEKSMRSRVNRHIDHLQSDPAHGLVIGVVDGKYRFLSEKEVNKKKERKSEKKGGKE